MHRKRAIIEITTKLLDNAPFKVAEWFAELKLLVSDVEHIHYRGITRYHVYSEKLPEVPLGEAAKTYNLDVRNDGVRLIEADIG